MFVPQYNNGVPVRLLDKISDFAEYKIVMVENLNVATPFPNSTLHSYYILRPLKKTHAIRRPH